MNKFKASLIVLTKAPVDLSSSLQEIFDCAIKEAQNEDKKNAMNYTKKYFSVYDQEAISLVLFNSKCVGFSSIWNRKNFWGKRVFRVLNRTWKKFSYRNKSRKINFLFSKEMLQQQINFLDKNIKDYTAFVSREGNCKKSLSWLLKMNNNFKLYKGWYLVCPDRENYSCWHTVCSIKESKKYPFALEKKK